MTSLPKKLQQKLDKRSSNNALRKLTISTSLVDFSSNDYLGFAKSEALNNKTYDLIKEKQILQNGATGSRLLSGNYNLYNEVESQLSEFHNSENALVFNSGYDANIGFFSSVPQRNDVIIYDEFSHASIRDGIQLSNAKAYKFKHNNLGDLEKKCQTERSQSPKETTIYIVTESIFSMDGDSPDLKTMSQISKTYNAYLIVDEAHAIGVFGKHGRGKIQELGLENDVFARIITFGKALGAHGAAILGSDALKSYLINFSRSFIYTTGLPPHSLATISIAYRQLVISSAVEKPPIKKLHQNIQYFKSEVIRLQLNKLFITSNSAIHCCIISGNKNVKSIAQKLQCNGFDIKPILSPTVPKDKERLRFCLHSYNSTKEIQTVLSLLKFFLNK